MAHVGRSLHAVGADQIHGLVTGFKVFSRHILHPTRLQNKIKRNKKKKIYIYMCVVVVVVVVKKM